MSHFTHMRNITVIRCLVGLLLMMPCAVLADTEDRMKEGANYCHDEEALRKSHDLLAKNPNDPLIIKLTALRAGLCQFVDENKIELEQAIDIFANERERGIVERTQEELIRHPKPML